MGKKLDKILDGVPQATREEVEIGKFIHDSVQGKWRQIEGLLNEALLIGKFRGTSPPIISETGFYPLKINSNGELEVSLSATSALNINVEDVEALLTDIKAILTFTGDDFETVIDAIKAAIDNIKTNTDNLTFTGDSFEVVIDALKAQIDKLTFLDTTKLSVKDNDLLSKLEAVRLLQVSLESKIDTLDSVIDLIKVNSDKFAFDVSNNLKIVKG